MGDMTVILQMLAVLVSDTQRSKQLQIREKPDKNDNNNVINYYFKILEKNDWNLGRIR